VGAPYAVAVSSCSAGLHLALLVAGIGPGDEVITTPLTFPATANMVIHTGATPVFADVDPATQNLDPQAVAAAVTDRTRAILPVHMAGRPCDLDGLHAVARAHGLLVIEDAAHALGAEYHGGKVGTHSDATCFSFYATKNLTTGEGGMVVTSRADWVKRIAMYRQHGLSSNAWSRDHARSDEPPVALVAGFKYNMPDLHAALGLGAVDRLDDWLRRREDIWARYDDAFAGLPVDRPEPPAPATVVARHLYTLQLHLDRLGIDRRTIQEELRRMGIGTAVHFPPLHLQPLYTERFGYRAGQFPNAERIGRRTLSLPLTQWLTDDEVEHVIGTVTAVLAAGGGPAGAR
jgi:dTDP-4-amino-4,6-dideoxygalactose transaminase